MTDQEFNAKAEKHGKIISVQAEILEQVRNLAWKQAQPGCYTEERQSRIDKLQSQFDNLKLEASLVWGN